MPSKERLRAALRQGQCDRYTATWGLNTLDVKADFALIYVFV